MILQNPHFSYLKSRHTPYFFDVLRTILPWVMLCNCGTLILMLVQYRIAFDLLQIIAVATFALSVLVPTFLAVNVARRIAQDIINGYYPLLILTPLTNQQLIRSYFYATLWQVGHAIWLLIIMFSATATGTLWFTIIGTFKIHLFTLILLWLCWGVQIIGWSLAMITVGMVIGLRWHEPSMLNIFMPMLTLFILGTSALLTAYNIVVYEKLSLIRSSIVLCFMVLPYVVLLVGLRYAEHNAHKV